MLAEVVDAVVGVDTHRDTHEVEIASPNGVPIARCSIRNDSTGYAQLLAWIVDHAPGPRLVVSIEGTRSYGVGLSRALTAAGLPVLECRAARPQAHDTARASPTRSTRTWPCWPRCAWTPTGCPAPRVDGDREALRILLGARHELTVAATAQTNRLRALLLGSDDDADRDLARGALVRRRADRAGPPPPAPRAPPASRRCATARSADSRWPCATARRALKDNRAQLQAIVDDMAPGLTDRRGIGPVTAAQVIVGFSHPGRCRNDAAFAALSGTSPLEASSGRTVRHRLNRGGDRALNSALHTIAMTRMRCCPSTKAYVARRTAEGKTTREIRRCLKRYIARELYRALTATMAATTASDSPA